MKIGPWHSKKNGETYYHNNTKCELGGHILPHYLVTGTANRPLCPHCASLDEAEQAKMVEVEG